MQFVQIVTQALFRQLGLLPHLSALILSTSHSWTGPNLVSKPPFLSATGRLRCGCGDVTTWGSGKYSFLQPTTCQIAPKLTTSLVTYASQTLNVTVVNSTALNSSNVNLALFLASIIDYQSANTQGLASNSIGDALYSIAVSTGTSTNDSGPMDPSLIGELVSVLTTGNCHSEHLR